VKKDERRCYCETEEFSLTTSYVKNININIFLVLLTLVPLYASSVQFVAAN